MPRSGLGVLLHFCPFADSDAYMWVGVWPGPPHG